MYYLDTSVVLRYTLGEHPLLSPRAAAMIEVDDQDGEDRVLTDAIIAEVGYVLTKVYRIPRNEAIDRRRPPLGRHPHRRSDGHLFLRRTFPI